MVLDGIIVHLTPLLRDKRPFSGTATMTVGGYGFSTVKRQRVKTGRMSSESTAESGNCLCHRLDLSPPSLSLLRTEERCWPRPMIPAWLQHNAAGSAGSSAGEINCQVNGRLTIQM